MTGVCASAWRSVRDDGPVRETEQVVYRALYRSRPSKHQTQLCLRCHGQQQCETHLLRDKGLLQLYAASSNGQHRWPSSGMEVSKSCAATSTPSRPEDPEANHSRPILSTLCVPPPPSFSAFDSQAGSRHGPGRTQGSAEQEGRQHEARSQGCRLDEEGQAVCRSQESASCEDGGAAQGTFLMHLKCMNILRICSGTQCED